MPTHRREPRAHGDRGARAIALGVLAVATLIGAGRAGPPAKDGSRSHWSFRPIRRPAPPTVRHAAWVRNPIDAFVLRPLEAEGLSPAPPASRMAWLRRASFDLRGLPPSPDEVARFLADDRPDADERLIDRLLASPAYGERWGRHWLDVVRYADSGGFEADLRFNQSWRYRDHVIRSIAADKPFDRFIREQVAGDELWPDDPEASLGSGMYAVGPAQADAAMVSGQLEYDWLTDAADTTGEAFLGLTMGCARCHDHKYDPIRQADYFAMQAIFAASDRPYPEKVRTDRIKAINGILSEVPVPKALRDDPRCTVRVEGREGPRLFHRAEPVVVRRLHRGELSRPMEVVAPAFPAALMPPGRDPRLGDVAPTKRRAALADWLVSPENPLTARVLANRAWGWHSGRAIVRTPNDFGSQGDEPTHPDLLDFLAAELRDHGWSLKHLHRLIMLSSTYRMSSVAGDRSARDDPEGRRLEHFPRRRLEGEEIRDAMLACSGRLVARPFGPPVVPPLGREELTGLFDAKSKWPVTKDPAEHTRRSVYLLVRRTFAYPMFSAFDSPEVMTSCPRRLQTIVPTQALAMLNSPLAREEAAAFARRVLREGGGDPEGAARRGWMLAFGRPITPAEAARAREFLSRRAAAGSHSREAAMAELCLVLFNANEFLFVD